MSMLDRVIAAVIPIESDEARRSARSKAQAASTPGDWLAMVLEHHAQIEAAFAAVQEAPDAAARTGAQKMLGILLMGHSNAEEAVIYPGLALANEKGHANTAYTEQAIAKIQMAELGSIPPMTQDYLDKLESIRDALAHHFYVEEGNWFLGLVEKTLSVDQAKITRRYQEEFERYVGQDLLRLVSR